jgi:hypothetical protein
MKIIITAIVILIATSDRTIPKNSGLTEGHIEFLKDHEAYEDFMEAFYPDSSKNSL